MKPKDEHQEFLAKLATYLYDEEDYEQEVLSPEEEMRAKDFIAKVKARTMKEADEQRLSWVREAEASRAKAKSVLEQAAIARPDRIAMLSKLQGGGLLAARGMERGLDEMSDDELFALYRSRIQAEILDKAE